MYHPLSDSFTSRIFNCQIFFSVFVMDIRWFLVIIWLPIVRIVWVSTRSHATYTHVIMSNEWRENRKPFPVNKKSWNHIKKLRRTEQMTYKNIVIRWQTILLMKIDLQYDKLGGKRTNWGWKIRKKHIIIGGWKSFDFLKLSSSAKWCENGFPQNFHPFSFPPPFLVFAHFNY